MRRTFVVVAITGAVIAAVAPSAGAQEPEDPDAEAELVLSVGGQVAPKAVSVDKAPSGPNPYLALVPDPAALDYSGWERYADRQGEVRAELDRVVTSPILVDEDEPENTWLERQSRSGRGRPGLRHAGLRQPPSADPRDDVAGAGRDRDGSRQRRGRRVDPARRGDRHRHRARRDLHVGDDR